MKAVKFFAVIWTLIYIILFLPVLYASCFSLGLLGDPDRAEFASFTLVLLAFCIPVSMPVSIYLMWRNFSRQNYKWTIFFEFLPWITFGVVVSLGQILADFSRRPV